MEASENEEGWLEWATNGRNSLHEWVQCADRSGEAECDADAEAEAATLLAVGCGG